MNDCDWMRRALELAERGCGWVSPNPMVGAVIVRDGQLIGEGWHEKYGQAHAERNALASLSQSPEGATMYVTLEPCCHYGKQPPCVDAILEAGIRRVVVGAGDPNPLVAGKGIARLRAAGVEVVEGVLREACERINEVFFHYIRSGTPYVVMKYAMTMDGKIATHTGASKWITGEAARAHVQTLRHRYSAIMVGVGTVLADDPLLTCRMPGGKNPVRVVCDSALRTPPEAKVIQTAREVPTILATCCTERERYRVYEQAGCQILCVESEEGRVSLPKLMKALGGASLDSVLLEGGGTLNWAALHSGIVNKVLTYVAPKLFGGKTAPTAVGGVGVSLPEEAALLQNCRVRQLGADFLIESEVAQGVHRDC